MCAGDRLALGSRDLWESCALGKRRQAWDGVDSVTAVLLELVAWGLRWSCGTSLGFCVDVGFVNVALEMGDMRYGRKHSVCHT